MQKKFIILQYIIDLFYIHLQKYLRFRHELFESDLRTQLKRFVKGELIQFPKEINMNIFIKN